MAISKKEWKIDLIILSLFSLTYGIVMIAIDIFEWRLYETLTGFLATPLIIISQGILLVLILMSVIYIGIRVKEIRWKAFLPLAINTIVLGVVLFVPFKPVQVNIEADVFESKKEGFKQVVSLVENGKLVPDQIGTASLPEELKDLSSGQIISIDFSDGVTSVFFYNFGVLDNFSGYMYRSNDTPPPFELIGDWYIIERMEQNWYYCVSN